jgi:peptidoglycan/LPS O-acetylase OafA/YrhL
MHVSGIDRLRAYAALSVMLAHIVGPHLPGPLRYVFTGHPAVVAFFVISGFCIHRPYIERPLPVLAFWSSRVLRILPPALAAMALAQIAGLRQFNFADGYILWSIVCEAWYYALYPAFLAASRVVGWRVLTLAAVAAWLALILTFGSDEYGNATVYGPWLNWLIGLPSWLAGCALAERRSFEPPAVPVAVWRAAVAVTASVLYWATINTPIGFYLTMNPFVLLVVPWIAAEIGAAKRPTAADGLGRWSFSIYLFHIPAAALLERAGLHSPALLVPAVLLACYLATRAIEIPAHRAARAVFARLAPPARAALVRT